MIDIIAAVLGMCGSALNMNLSTRLQMYGISLWLLSDILLIWFLWAVSPWVVLMYVFYTATCTIGIWKRWNIPLEYTEINKTVKDGVPDEEKLTNVNSKNEPHGSKLCIPNDADCGYCPDLRNCVHFTKRDP